MTEVDEVRIVCSSENGAHTDDSTLVDGACGCKVWISASGRETVAEAKALGKDVGLYCILHTIGDPDMLLKLIEQGPKITRKTYDEVAKAVSPDAMKRAMEQFNVEIVDLEEYVKDLEG